MQDKSGESGNSKPQQQQPPAQSSSMTDKPHVATQPETVESSMGQLRSDASATTYVPGTKQTMASGGMISSAQMYGSGHTMDAQQHRMSVASTQQPFLMPQASSSATVYMNTVSGNQSPGMAMMTAGRYSTSGFTSGVGASVSPTGGVYNMGGASYNTGYVSQSGYSAHGQVMSSATQSYTLRDQTRILSERVIEHEVRVPKKVVREDVIEKVVIIPEKIIHEEVIEETAKVREKIIEVATPVIQERVVEVPEIEYVEKIVEVPEIIYQEKIKEVPRIEIQERIVEIPRIVVQEKVIEVPEIEYREVPYEKLVEVPEVVEQIVVKEIPVPQYVDKPVPEYVTVEVEQEVNRAIPVPVESVATCEFLLPRLRPRYTRIDVPLYVPRFVEVPVPVDTLDATTIAQAEQYAQHVTMLTSQGAVSLCEVENLAGSIKNADFASLLSRKEYLANLTQHWQSGRLQIEPATLRYVNSASYNSAVTGTISTGTVYPAERVVSTYTTVGGAQVIGAAPMIIPGLASNVVTKNSSVTTAAAQVGTGGVVVSSNTTKQSLIETQMSGSQSGAAATAQVDLSSGEQEAAEAGVEETSGSIESKQTTTMLNAGLSTSGVIHNGGVVQLSGSDGDAGSSSADEAAESGAAETGEGEAGDAGAADSAENDEGGTSDEGKLEDAPTENEAPADGAEGEERLDEEEESGSAE